MKIHKTIGCLRAFTLIELLAVVACVALLGLTLLSAQTVDQSAVQRTRCQNNLKQVGLAFRTWEGDYNDKYPMSVPVKQGGSKEALAGTNLYRHFAVMSKEINNPGILVCPADTRTTASSFAAMNNANLSYFAGLDADETIPLMALSGDRNLVTNGVPVVAGLVTITARDTVGWSEKIHVGAGNIGLADGAVQQTSSAGLQALFQRTGTSINRLAVP